MNAQTLGTSGEISITGIVPPAKYVYIDTNRNITQIISNSPFDADPVFITNTTPPQKITPTDQLISAYNTLKSRYNFSRYGTVYDSALDQIKAIGLQSSLPLLSLNANSNLTVASGPTKELLSLAD